MIQQNAGKSRSPLDDPSGWSVQASFFSSRSMTPEEHMLLRMSSGENLDQERGRIPEILSNLG